MTTEMTFEQLMAQRRNILIQMHEEGAGSKYEAQILSAYEKNRRQLLKTFPKEYHAQMREEGHEDTDEEYEAPEKYELCRFCCDTYVEVSSPHLTVGSRICCPDCENYARNYFKET